MCVIAPQSIFIMAVLKSLSENSKICVISVLAAVKDGFFSLKMRFSWFLLWQMIFQIRPGHFGYYVLRVWVLCKSCYRRTFLTRGWGTDSLLPGGWGSPGTLLGLLWHPLCHSWGLSSLSVSAAFSLPFRVQVDLGDIAGSVPDHSNKANITLKRVPQFFVFPVHIKVMFTLYCSLLSVQ